MRHDADWSGRADRCPAAECTTADLTRQSVAPRDYGPGRISRVQAAATRQWTHVTRATSVLSQRSSRSREPHHRKTQDSSRILAPLARRSAGCGHLSGNAHTSIGERSTLAPDPRRAAWGGRGSCALSVGFTRPLPLPRQPWSALPPAAAICPRGHRSLTLRVWSFAR